MRLYHTHKMAAMRKILSLSARHSFCPNILPRYILCRSISTSYLNHTFQTNNDKISTLKNLRKTFRFSKKISEPNAINSTSALVPIESTQSQDQIHMQKKVWEEASQSEEEAHWEKFIPITRQVLVRTLAQEDTLLSPDERHNMENFAAALDAYISQRFYVQLEDMKLLYDLMDPDKDTIEAKMVTLKELLDDEYWLLQKLEMLLYKANYFKIHRSKTFKLLLEHDTREGVRVSVNPAEYATLRIWTRGRKTVSMSIVKRLKFGMRKMIIKENKDFPLNNEIFTRVFVAVRSRKEKKLHLKVFKDVPCNELEYLLPDGKILMSRFDKGFLASSIFLGTLAIAMKSFALFSNLKLDLAWFGLGLAALIGARGWIGYKNKRNKYLVNLSRTLYFKTVSNNRGVLTLLTDRAQDEEFKEALLAYVFLLSPPNRRGVLGLAYTTGPPIFDTRESLQTRIEKWLLKKFDFQNISFDIDDALVKLDNMGLLVRHADETLSAIPMEIALDTLPRPGYQWLSLGALRDSESAEEGSGAKEDVLLHHHGWN